MSNLAKVLQYYANAHVDKSQLKFMFTILSKHHAAELRQKKQQGRQLPVNVLDREDDVTWIKFNDFLFNLWSGVYVSRRKTASNLLRDLDDRRVFGPSRWTYKRRTATPPPFSAVTTRSRDAAA